jgi:hypothetical protein
MKRRLLILGALLLSTLVALPAVPALALNLWCSVVPLGALAGQPPPIWCLDPPETGPGTAIKGSNTWLDEFNHGLSTASLGPDYVSYEGLNGFKTQHWRHNDHWMVDVSGQDPDGPPPWNWGAGGLMRPAQSFRFVNGKLVVEADVAAGVEDYAGNAWPEIVVSMAPQPTGKVVDVLYGYGQFGGFWTVGCRLQAQRSPICALYSDTAENSGNGGRVFEISAHQWEGATVTGGGPFTPEQDAAWRVCRGTDPDENCRDRFRWEITKDTLTIFVNGVLYMRHAGLPPDKQIPDAMLSGNVYVYLADWIYLPDDKVVRFHWDRLAVNPAGGGTAPTPTPVAATPTPTRTPTPVPGTATPTPVPGTSTTVTFDDKAGQDQALNGQYPTNVINWGTGQWWHSGPFGAFTTKSVSFTEGRTSSVFTFVSPKKLVSLKAFNGGGSSDPATVTLACSGQPTKTVSVPFGQVTTITTGWTGACTTVTVTSSKGWDLNVDDFVIQ